ncbi:MAG: ferredoxin--NADP reductase [Phycisphaerae bacterium]
MKRPALNATIAERDDLNDNLCVIRVRPDSGRIPEFEPGQFITLGLLYEECSDRAASSDREAPPQARMRSIRRPYSIASSDRGVDYLEFLIVLVERGRLTTRLWKVEQGGRLWMGDRIHGDFTLTGVPADKDLVLVSTGTGIAPYMSMLRRYRGQGRWRRLVMINGVRKVNDLAYREELEAAARRDPTITYIPLVSRARDATEWAGLRGRVQLALASEIYERHVGAPLDSRECHVFLCGNPQMIQGVEKLLVPRGFRLHTKKTPGNLHYERYW